MTVDELMSCLTKAMGSGMVKPEMEIFFDVVSDEHGCVRAYPLAAWEVEHAHDEDDTPYVVLEAIDINDAPPTGSEEPK